MNGVIFRDNLVIILKGLTITRADYSRDYRHDQVFLSSFRVNHVTCLDNLSTFSLDDIIEWYWGSKGGVRIGSVTSYFRLLNLGCFRLFCRLSYWILSFLGEPEHWFSKLSTNQNVQYRKFSRLICKTV